MNRQNTFETAWQEGEEAYLREVVRSSMDEHLVECAQRALAEIEAEARNTEGTR